MTPSTYSGKKSGGQQEGGHEVVHHVQVEHFKDNFKRSECWYMVPMVSKVKVDLEGKNKG